MAAGMDWALVDVNQKEQCDEVYDLLTNNYVEVYRWMDRERQPPVAFPALLLSTLVS
jgi:hypothetical protein